MNAFRKGCSSPLVAISGEVEIFAKCIEQGGPRPKQQPALDAIYVQAHLEHWRQAPLRWLVSCLLFPLHCLTLERRRAAPKRPT